MEYRVLTKAMNLFPFQELYFTTIDYDNLKGIYNGKSLSLKEIANKKIVLLTGIASPKQIVTDLSPLCNSIIPITFGDHHAFTDKDIEYINPNIYVLPIHVTFMLGQGEKFNHKILSYVRKNSRNAKLLKAKNEQPAKNSSKPVNKPRTISFKNN